MSKNSGGNAGGVGFIGLLTVCLIMAKLCGFADFSWWWCIAPAGAAFVTLVVAVVYLVASERAK